MEGIRMRSYDLGEIPVEWIRCMARLHEAGRVSPVEVAVLRRQGVTYPLLDELEKNGFVGAMPDGPDGNRGLAQTYMLTERGKNFMLIFTAPERGGVM